MKNLYEIEYESKHTINGKTSGWSRNDALHVVANGNISKAIRKAERHVRRQVTRFHEDGEVLVDRCVAVRVTSVKQVASIDVL